MTRPKVTHDPVGIGPPVPRVDIRDFSKHTVPEKIALGMWEIIGPSVKHHLAANLPLWKIITFAYMEGVMHGSGLEKEAEKRRNESRRSQLYRSFT